MLNSLWLASENFYAATIAWGIPELWRGSIAKGPTNEAAVVKTTGGSTLLLLKALRHDSNGGFPIH